MGLLEEANPLAFVSLLTAGMFWGVRGRNLWLDNECDLSIT